MWFGYEIEVVDKEWVFSDTGKPTVGSDRSCGHCHRRQTVEGHDACLGTLPEVKNACCGHGRIAEAYVQLPNGKTVRGRDAAKLVTQLKETT